MDTKLTFREIAFYGVTLTKTYIRVIWMLLAARGPKLAIDLFRYPWILYLLKLYSLYKIPMTRKGPYRDGSVHALNEIVLLIGSYLADMLKNSDTLVLAEDIIPPEIVRAMGLTPFSPEILAIVLVLISPDSTEKYIDACENSGIPGDICSLPKCAIGMILKGHLHRPRAIIASNLPCDAGMASYLTIEKNMNVPIMRVDVPYNFKTDRAIAYFTEELRQMIQFLETHTTGRMNWERLKQICEERNRCQEAELELWDLAKIKPAPVASEMIYLTHLVFFNIFPGDKRCTATLRKLIEYCKINLEASKGALDQENFRILLWTPPWPTLPIHFPGPRKNTGPRWSWTA